MMGEKPRVWFKLVLGLAFVAGLVLALVRADLAYIVRPAVGLMMIACGLFFVFGRLFVEPPSTDPQRALRRALAAGGAGNVVVGISQLLAMGWTSTGCMALGAVILIVAVLKVCRAKRSLAHVAG